MMQPEQPMMNYPPGGASPNAPPPGINPAFVPPPYPESYPPATGPGGPPITYPPASGPGYPQPGNYPAPGGYLPSGDGYPPQGYPPSGGDYPAQGGYPPSSDYPPQGYPQPAGPVTYQPTSGYPQPEGPPGDGNWMPRPTGIAVCPPGLEYLAMIDQLIVHQKVELLEAFLSFETKNKYSIKNSMGQKIYTAKEDSDCCTRNCLGTIRPFDMKIKDTSGNEVIHFYRPFNCDSCLCPCCLQRMEVMAPPGCVIGSVVQEWSICSPKFRVEDASGETVLRIEGPLCTFSICGDVEFKVMSKEGDFQVGKITKQWAGLLREAFTDADHFGITFPMDLAVNMKAVLLGACFLIDFMFFEKQGNKENDGPGML